jgi:subtilisin family serine protease
VAALTIAWLSLGVTFAGPSAGPPAPTHYTYRGEAKALDPDETRVAVRFQPGLTTEERASALVLAGLDPSSVEPTGAGEWRLATLTEAAREPLELRRRIDALLARSQVEFASPVFVGPKGRQDWMTPTSGVLLRFRRSHADAAARDLAALAPDMEVVSEKFGDMPGAFALRSDARNGFDVLARANELAADPRIAWAEVDMLFSGGGALIPNDPGWTDLWGMLNTGQFGGVPGVDMDADLAWDVTTGSADIKVLVIDTGVQQDHPDINQLPGADFTSDGGDGGPVNACDLHGTAVAGGISAILDNSIGTVGIAPDSPVLSARSFISNSPCTGNWSSAVSWTVNALAWGATEGARVSNNSNFYGGGLISQAIEDEYALTYANGMVHFASAGNDNIDGLTWPASLPLVNAVSAIAPDGEKASFSNFNSGVSVSAPGVTIYTTDRTGTDGYTTGDYTFFNGTSAASPYAAGVAALILSLDPGLSAAEVEQNLRCSASDFGAPGFDEVYGHGFVNAADAVDTVVGGDSDGDGSADVCDNCVDLPNPDQSDLDGDGVGDLCDDCTDSDADGVGDPGRPEEECGDDNCPLVSNAGQEDDDGDGDGNACDSCPAAFNPSQADGDGDGVGNLCDVCPEIAEPLQSDFDGDGAGNACDCEIFDPNDLAPRDVDQLTVERSETGSALLTWTAAPGADAYSVTASPLGALGTDSYGSCLAEGIAGTGFEDTAPLAPGEGRTYVVQGQNFDCGLGTLGFTSDEAQRTNLDPGACAGQSFSDDYAIAESSIAGDVAGTFADTFASDNVRQTINEEISGGSPSTRYSFLEHRWTFDVTAGGTHELHVEGFRTDSTDGDDFAFEYSEDGGGSWLPVSLASLPLGDNAIDLVGALPLTVSGTVIVRVRDTNRDAEAVDVDSVAIDELFVRTVP